MTTMSTEAAPSQAVNPAAQTLAPPNQAATSPDGTFQKPPVGTPERPAPQELRLPTDEVRRLYGLESKLAEIERTRQSELDAKEAERIQALTKAGKIEEAMQAAETQWQSKQQAAEQKYLALRNRLYNERLDATINEALVGRDLAGSDEKTKAAAAGYVRKILRDELEAVEGDEGTIHVVEKGTRRPGVDVLRERLSSPELAIFLASNNRGGSGTDATRPPASHDTTGRNVLAELGLLQSQKQTGLTYK